MAGTVTGGKKAAATNKAKHGADFYAKIGAKGGRLGRTGGFATYMECRCKDIAGTHYKQQCAGKKGGYVSKRRDRLEISAPLTGATDEDQGS